MISSIRNAIGNLTCGMLLVRGVLRTHILLAGFGVMGPCGFAIFSQDVPGVLAYALCLVFSAVGGLIPVALFDAAPRHAPRPELVGATVGFLMQGNNVGLVLGPAATGAIAAAAGWPAVSLLVPAIAVAAGILVCALKARSG